MPSLVVQVIESPGSKVCRSPKIIPDTAVVTRNTAVAVPDTSAREMTGPFSQSVAVCPFVDLGRQADGRDLECPQVSAGVVEIAGDGCIADVLARTAPISCVDHRIVDAPGLGHQPATIQSTGMRLGVRGSPLPGR